MGRFRWPQMTLLGRIVLFLSAFGAAMALQIGIGYYQTRYVLEPLEKRSESIQTISRFLNDMEACMTALENHRWDYGDTASLIETVQEGQRRSAAHLEDIETDLRVVSEEQYLLANAAQTTYRTLCRTLDAIVSELQADRSAQASELYYSSAEPCGTYLRQYTQQLLERACFDNQDAHLRLTQLNEGLQQAQTVVVLLCLATGTMLVVSLVRLLWAAAALAQASQAISRGEFDTPDLDESPRDETGHTARAFNEMKRSMKRQVELLEEKNAMENRLHAKELEALELQTLMEREKLQQLRSQINPHFLFNTLNVILYTSQQEGAERTHALIGSLSRLFRYALGSNESQVPLLREVKIVDEFAALYRARFGDRLALCWHISPGVDLPDTLVPSFILQPLVENAFKHGIAPKEEGGCVDVHIQQEDGALKITVADDGVGMSREALEALRSGLKDPPTTGEHIGVYNVAARLRLWGREYGMDIQSQQGKGTAAVLRLPQILSWEEEGGGEGDDQDPGGG